MQWSEFDFTDPEICPMPLSTKNRNEDQSFYCFCHQVTFIQLMKCVLQSDVSIPFSFSLKFTRHLVLFLSLDMRNHLLYDVLLFLYNGHIKEI